jgi:hypothetical protein
MEVRKFSLDIQWDWHDPVPQDVATFYIQQHAFLFLC